jgi:hypothetical protein
VFVPGKSPVKVQPKILDIFLRELYIVYIDWGEHSSLYVVNVIWTDLDLLAFILHFLTSSGLWPCWCAVSVFLEMTQNP